MLPKPANFDQLWGEHAVGGMRFWGPKLGTRMELKLEINGLTFSDESIVLGSCRVRRDLLSRFNVGNANSARLELTLLPGAAEVADFGEDAAEAVLSCRLVSDSVSTAWIQQGVFYLDEIAQDAYDGSLSLVMYDALSLLDVGYYREGEQIPAEGTVASKELFESVCERFGIEFAGFSQDYGLVSYPEKQMTCRALLRSIAAMYGANLTMTPSGMLKAVEIGDLRIQGTGRSPNYTSDVSQAERFSIDRTLYHPTAVTLRNGRDEFTSGNAERGLHCAGETIYASYQAAARVLGRIRGERLDFRYRFGRAEGVVLSPLFELGDKVTIPKSNTSIYGVDAVNDSFIVTNCTLRYATGLYGNISSTKPDAKQGRIIREGGISVV